MNTVRSKREEKKGCSVNVKIEKRWKRMKLKRNLD